MESKGELITARIKKVERPLMEENFRLIGRLIGFTRQLDVLLRNEKDIDFFTDKFLKNEQEQNTLSP